MDDEEFQKRLTELLSEGLSEGVIVDACLVMATPDGLRSIGIMDEPDEEVPSRTLRLVSHWMYHVFSGAPSHKTITRVTVKRKGSKRDVN